LPTPSANPRFGQADVEQLLSDVFVASRRSLIHMDRAIPTPTAGSLRTRDASVMNETALRSLSTTVK
jgi:hypothetical protein